MKRFLYGIGLALALSGSAFAQSSNSGGSGGGNPTGATYSGQVQDWNQNGIQSFVKTYKYSSLSNTPAATPTDIFSIAGSATKTIRISRIVVGGLATTAGDLNPLLIRRSAPDTGGTCTSQASNIMVRDTNNSTATATLSLCTANPTTGTTVGTLDSCRLSLQLATATPDVCVFAAGTSNDQMTVLRGVNDVLAINFAGAAVPAGGVIDLDVEWTEEP